MRVFLTILALLCAPLPAFSQNVPAVNSALGCATGGAVGNLSGALGCVPTNVMSFTSTATTAVVNTSTPTTVVGSGVGSMTLPSGFCYVGKTYRLKVYGKFSTLLTPGNLTAIVKLGSTTIGTVTVTNLLASATNAAWEGEYVFAFRTCGASGSVIGGGTVQYDTGALIQGSAALGSGSAITIDTTGAPLLDATATWATASTSNSIGTYLVTLEALN